MGDWLSKDEREATERGARDHDENKPSPYLPNDALYPFWCNGWTRASFESGMK